MREVGFKHVFEIIEYMVKNNIDFQGPVQEIYPPDVIALKSYVYHYFANDVLIRSARSVTHPWVSQYNVVEQAEKTQEKHDS